MRCNWLRPILVSIQQLVVISSINFFSLDPAVLSHDDAAASLPNLVWTELFSARRMKGVVLAVNAIWIFSSAHPQHVFLPRASGNP
jgi:hypothetical protein